MSYNIIVLPDALRDAKQLAKRYVSFKQDLAALIDSLSNEPQQGESLGKGCYKVRLAIRSKNKGKSGGARVITCVRVTQETVYLLAMYDKSDADTISAADLDIRLSSVP